METNTDPPHDDDQHSLPDDFETTEHIYRTDTGASIKLTMTRGTGTRDQERLEGTVKAPTVEQAKADIDELFPKLCRLAEAARAFDPSIDISE
ncbi:hypothetical protein [Haloarchaeobius sp. HME9146]|uniref:DUF7389 domain-containing protein n=1 Tax=Haloarchaeobius sp. HME9146 TaxID=2978732 RepID=UPI0021C06CD2|nr:hypothetical protein [Haloarchaeobius sp. HME9146]MCT9098164.1 hypothetical protein [Haloarchaeobius sp. HME9146]